jgi:RNA 3'-terminal phosphate cyclase (ATP)
MLTIDGTLGEGGGQILRTALALSLVLGRPFRIENLRGGRPRPGLRPQHLVCVQAAAEVGRATVQGAEVASRQVTFAPGRAAVPGEWRFDIGSAGSTTLVAQTLLPALMLAGGPSRVTLIGGTHNPLAPPFEFLSEVWLPLLSQLGPVLGASLGRPGYYPRGGGELRLEVAPVRGLRALDLRDRGRLVAARATVRIAALPRHIAEREIAVVCRRLAPLPVETAIVDDPGASGPGNVLLVRVEHEKVCELFSSFGRRGVPAETVAEEAVAPTLAYLATPVAAGPHLADQLLLPLALAGGAFTTLSPTLHTTTNARIIAAFLDAEPRLHEITPGRWLVESPGPRRERRPVAEESP